MNELRGPIVAAVLAGVMLMAPRARADGGEAAAAAPAETAPWSGLHFDVEAAGGAVVVMTSVPARAALQVGPGLSYGVSRVVELRVNALFLYWSPDPGGALAPEVRFHLGDHFFVGVGAMGGVLFEKVETYPPFMVGSAPPPPVTSTQTHGLGGGTLALGAGLTDGLSLFFQTGVLASGAAFLPVMGGLSYRF